MGDIITFYGKTDGAKTEDDFTLDSEVLENPISYIRPDKGMRCKIWARWIAGAKCTVYVQQTEDITADSPTWKTIGAFRLSSEGELHEDERHAFEVASRDGKQAVKFTWEQAVAAVTHVAAKIEFQYKGT